MNKVVITGIGVVSPIGTGQEAFTLGLKSGKVGLRTVCETDPDRFGEYDPSVKAFTAENFEPPIFAKILDPGIQYILKSTEEALFDAGLDLAQMNRERVGITVSTSKGGMSTIERFYDRFQKNRSALLGARIYANTLPNIAAQWIARHWKITGPAKCAIAACATGLFAIIEGLRMIEQGEIDYCIAGAGDASITKLMFAGYKQMGVLSETVMRPFDKRRDGFFIGEGAGIVILENEQVARARKAKIYGRIIDHVYGFEGSNTIAFEEKSDGLAHCLNLLMKKSGIHAREIDYLNLHGTATTVGDRYETSQIKKAFGSEAYKISMSSTKSMVGHMLGATGAVEVIACALAMKHGFVPPTMNLEQPDPACDLNYTSQKREDKKINLSASISMGFGGQLAAILIRK